MKVLAPFLPSDVPTGVIPDRNSILFRKLLIANRGEIACRIIRTARRLQIPVATVYSDADRHALHTTLADESIYIGASRPSESYLNVERIMQAARQVGADSLHPGYGFLSESGILSQACEDTGIEFIGPPSIAIQCMASKLKAAEIAIQAGIPVLPGFRESEQHGAKMLERVREIGFPVLIKAAFGGGGRGMSIVHSEKEFAKCLQAVRAQAREFFGDDLMIVEKYLSPARHVEVQIAADKRGHVIHLFDRDCSAQRRYQKIVEEARSPSISEKIRQQMYDAATSLTKALNYHNVGTVEFLLANDQFYFMEMNTRLQVEHPVTERIAGVDLVEWQLRIAAGESISQIHVPKKPTGHSIQARIYAENPAKDFLPSPGHIRYLHLPVESDRLQMHIGVRQGDLVDVHYDSLIAKIVVHDKDRKNAIERLRQGLNDLHVGGVDTNIEFLSKLLEDSAFQKDAIDIKFVENHLQHLTYAETALPFEMLVAALLYLAARSAKEKTTDFVDSDDLHSPWRRSGGWRLNSRREFACSFDDGHRVYNVLASFGKREINVKSKDHKLTCTNFHMTENQVTFTIDDKNWSVAVALQDDTIYLFANCRRYELLLSEQLSKADPSSSDAGSLTAPLPGRIARVLVNKGDMVSTGQLLIVIEAMKMEHPIASPINGVVTSIPFSENDLVEEGVGCIVVEPADGSEGKLHDEYEST